MGKKSVQGTDTLKTTETIRIGKTIFHVNHVFTPNQTKQEAWLSIIARAEGLNRRFHRNKTEGTRA